MHQISCTKIISGLLLIVCLVQASPSSSTTTATPSELMCYVCNDCSTITKQTPLEACNAEFFEKRSTTEDSATDPSTTNAPLTTTTETSTENTTTEVMSTETTTTTLRSTTEAVPTAPTVGPMSTTTMVTPVNVGIVPTGIDVVDAANVTMNNANNSTTESTTSTETSKALPLVAEDYTYHCYTLQKKMNGKLAVDRGCSRVTTMESVCTQVTAMNQDVVKCVPCSNSECNGSSALSVSMAALVFTLIAALLSRH